MKLLGLIQLTKLLFRAKGEMMSKEQIVSDVVAEIQAGVVQLYTEKVTEAIDKALAEMPPVGGLTQADVDAAVKVVTDQLTAQMNDMQAKDHAALEALQTQFDGMKAEHEALIAKESQESQVIAGLKNSLANIKAAEDLLAKLFPAPVEPDPQP